MNFSPEVHHGSPWELGFSRMLLVLGRRDRDGGSQGTARCVWWTVFQDFSSPCGPFTVGVKLEPEPQRGRDTVDLGLLWCQCCLRFPGSPGPVTVFFFLSSLLSLFRFLFLFFSLFLNKGGVGTQMCEKEQLFSISSLERL